jgi:acyl-CoA thioester hydrolase
VGGVEPGVTERADFPHLHPIATRWDDNDWLVREGGLDVHAGDVIGLCAESHCAYTAAVSFPDAVEVGLRAGHIGNSSVRYELAVFRAGDEQPSATGWFVHVFVDRATRRPVPFPARLRAALERLA